MRKSVGLIIVASMCVYAEWSFSDMWRSVSTHETRQEKKDAFTTINHLRQQAGMVPFRENRALDKAAQVHADYLVTYGVVTHRERSGRKGFSGTLPVDRALRAGYGSRFVSENLSAGNSDIRRSLYGLFSAIYHRFVFLDPSYDEIGIGAAQNKRGPLHRAYVYLMGNHALDVLCHEPDYRGKGRYVYGVCADSKHRIESDRFAQARTAVKERNPHIIVYPAEGQTEVLPAFYREEPDPLPEYDVSGYPVSVEFNDRYFRKVSLETFRLFEEGNRTPLRARLLDKQHDPHHRLNRRQFALMPLKRLKYATTYRAEIVYRHKKKRYTKRWRFSTQRPARSLRVITKKKTTLKLKNGRSYWLYFPPRNGHDMLGTMHYPAAISAHFVDPHTLEITIPPDRSKPITISGGGRNVSITIDS